MRVLRRSVPIALLAVMALTGTASAGASKAVSIKFFKYQPAKAKVALGGSVTWTNQDLDAHTATGDCCTNGPGLWDSGNLNQGQQYTFTFVAAGTYGYHCVYHAGMLGSVIVAPTATPKRGGTSTVFTITWASGAVPKGFDADIQIQVPGGAWASWLPDQKGTHVSAPYTPGAGTGTYRFRARLQNTGSGGATDWSPTVKIVVS